MGGCRGRPVRQMAIDGAVSALAPRALDASLGSSRSPPTLKFSGFIGFGDRRQPSRFSLCVGGVCGGGGGGGGGGGSERGGQQIRRHDTEFTEFRRLSNDRPARTRSEALHGRRRLTAPTLRLVFVVGASIFSCSGLRIRRRIACARLSRRVCVCVCVFMSMAVYYYAKKLRQLSTAMPVAAGAAASQPRPPPAPTPSVGVGGDPTGADPAAPPVAVLTTKVCSKPIFLKLFLSLVDQVYFSILETFLCQERIIFFV